MAMAIFKNCAEILSNINACREFFMWAIPHIRTALRNRNAIQLRVNDEIENLDTKLGQLESGIWKLKTAMPEMLDLIDRVEWQSHKRQASDLLPHIKDAVYEAEDLLDEFDYYALKLKVESSKRLGHHHLCDSFLEFFDSAGSNEYIQKLNEIQRKLRFLYAQFVNSGLSNALPKFDKSSRPETTSISHEPKVLGRERDLKQLLGKLGVCGTGKRGRTESKARMTELHVLPIVGMGGVGKTTMAQQICNYAAVKKHFDCITWACVSDDFDIGSLTEVIIEQLGGKTSHSDNLDGLMKKLEGCVKSKRFLLVLDDMWDDVFKQDGARWKIFCGGLENGAEGSRILVTTRSPEVANLVGPMNHYELKGLPDAEFWDFFKICAFGPTRPCNNRESLECIGKKIIKKLKGFPLAAKTIGCILRMDLSTSDWEIILQSELWQLEQRDHDILPALRLSYMYLSQKLKRCFLICAMYPKNHKFEKDFLADIWIGQGYVVDRKEASLYFDVLANRSFFQKASPYSQKYVVHDLMHDTAQFVSKDECFTIKHVSDIDRVPPNVRRLSIFTNGNVECSELKRICHKKKLRSLVCDESYGEEKDFALLIDCWFKELLKIRVLRFKVSSVQELPETMGNSKHLRYLCLLGGSNFVTLPSSICRLHHLKILEGAKDLSSASSDCRLQHLFDESVHGFSSLTTIKIDRCSSLTSIPLPVWSSNLPSLEELDIDSCAYLTSIGIYGASSGSSRGSGVEGFSSLAKISISRCKRLLSLDEFLTPDYLPVVKTVSVSWCEQLTSLSVDRLDGLQDLEVSFCPMLISQRVMTFPSSLKKLTLLSCESMEFININNRRSRSSSGLECLCISECTGLKSIGGATAIDTIKNVSISGSPELEEIQQPLNRGVYS